MRRVLVLLLLALSYGRDARAAGDDDWPCFLQAEGPRFLAALTHDLETSRQEMLDKLLGDLQRPDKAAACPAFDRAIAWLQHDVTTLYDETISAPRMLDRLRPHWTRHWNATQCAEVAALLKSAAASDPARTAGSPSPASERPLEVFGRWVSSPAGTAVKGNKEIALRVRDTLVDIRDEINLIALETNATLSREMPPIVRRDKAFATAAIDGCIAAEEKRLAQPAPNAAAAPPEALSIEPPAPFVVTHEQNGAIAYLQITSSTGKPVAVEADGALCQASFIENPYGDRHTQAEINDRIIKPESHEMLLAAGRGKMDIEPAKAFDREGIRGVEFVAREKKPATAGAARKHIYMVMIETPKGYTFLRCATTDEEFAAALPQLRSIRDAIRPPR
jgi:hypothetical protein